jgi:hypothetical protein
LLTRTSCRFRRLSTPAIRPDGCQRDCHIDLPNAAFVACSNLLDTGDRAGNDLAIDAMSVARVSGEWADGGEATPKRRGGRAEQRDDFGFSMDFRQMKRREVATFPLTELHPIPHGPGARRRIADCRGSVSAQRTARPLIRSPRRRREGLAALRVDFSGSGFFHCCCGRSTGS